MPDLIENGSGDEERILTEVGFTVAGSRFGRRVEVSVGGPTRLGANLVIPVSWRAAAHAGLFPRVDAQLEVAALGPRRTQVALSATYDPPLGPAGRVLDRTLLHRVAEAVVRDTVERIVTVIARGLDGRTD